MTNKLSMANKLGGIPLCLVVAVALAAEMFGDGLTEVPMMEILIVGLAVPLALYVSKKRSEAKSITKVAPVEKLAPWRQAAVSRATVAQAQVSKQKSVSAAPMEKNKQKAHLDTLLKEGNLKHAQGALTELIKQCSADAVSYNMVISACAKNG